MHRNVGTAPRHPMECTAPPETPASGCDYIVAMAAGPSALEWLIAHYEKQPIVLYTGAGVSATTSGRGIGNWDTLLRSFVSDRLTDEQLAEYDTEIAAQDPWRRASWIAQRLTSELLREAIHDRVRAPGTFQRKYQGLLLKDFIREAGTLRAVAAFTASLEGCSTSEQGRHYPRVEPNPRVPAVITTNYDPYLEAAASSMFRSLGGSHLLKPIGAIGSSAGLTRQTPVFHVHGYVPPEPSDEYESFVDPVLTKEDYRRAWKNRADSYTIGPQNHLLRHYTALFVGFSFRDRWVNRLLRRINGERESARLKGRDRLYHYAFVSETELGRHRKSWFDELGVRPILWSAPEEIAARLGELYRAGVADDIKTTGSIDLAEFTTVRPHGARPTGFSWSMVDVSAADFVWRNLECTLHSPLDAAPPGRRHRTSATRSRRTT